ncbi:MAG: magnesium transporter [Gemmatimonadetes bacterium]|nr:magnesium transporter [Gemmatimonadota bacterium]NIO32713.1 magnesium transporter [Gemmatimonadota bacterium]
MVRSAERPTKALVEAYTELYPDEVARSLEARPSEAVASFLKEQSTPRAVAVLERLLPDVAAVALAEIDATTFQAWVPALEPARAAELLARLEQDRLTSRLALLDPRLKQEIESLIAYPADSAGAIMDPRVTALHPDSTVEEATALLRKIGDRRVYHVFVVDAETRLLGAVNLQELAVSEPSLPLRDLITRTPVSVQATAAQSEAVELFEQHKLTSLPVTDFEGRLVGIIRHGVLVSAFQEEAAADIQKMVGVSKDERALSTVPFSVRKRLPWLQVNLATAFLAAFVVGLFEGTIAQYTALAVLLPVAAGQSGNTGAQALAVTMRGLALREIRVRHWLRLSFKELAVGFVNGCAVAVVTAIAVYFWSGSPGLAIVIGLAMVISMVIAGIAGASVPMVLTVLRQDPAQASSIILTTVTDVVGFLSFLGLATLAAGLL